MYFSQNRARPAQPSTPTLTASSDRNGICNTTAGVLAGAVFVGMLLLPLLASAHGPTRQKVTESIDIDAPPTDVWALIGEFAGADQWMPMITASSSDTGNEPGAIRTLVLDGGAEVIELLKKHDDEKMSFSYRIPDKTHDVAILPVSNYSSTLSVTASKGGSTVTWKGAFYRGYPNNDPPPELNDEAAVTAVSGLYQVSLANLKAIAESP